MMIARLILLIIFVLPLTGCPVKTYGLYRSYRIENTVPSFKCVEHVLKSIEGVSSVRYRIEEGGRPLTMHGIEKPNQIHRYFYTFSEVKNSFYFNVNYLGNTEYYHFASTTEKEKAGDLVMLLKPVILKIENAIENQCEFPGVVKKSNEECSRSICE